jgi:hypothetical protein
MHYALSHTELYHNTVAITYQNVIIYLINEDNLHAIFPKCYTKTILNFKNHASYI